MKSFRIIFIMFALFFITGCAVPATFTHNSPGYKKNSISRADVLVLPFITKFMTPNQRARFYEHKNQSRQPITQKEINLINNYLPLILQERTPAEVTAFEAKKISDKIILSQDTLTTESGKRFPAFVPEKSGIYYNGAMPDFLFFVEDAFFRKSGDTGGRSLGREPVDYFVMETGIDYLIWDNKSGKHVSFGRLTKDLKLLVLPDKKFYLMMLEKLADEILQNSPLKFRKVYF